MNTILFEKHCSYEQYKHVLLEPLEADIMALNPDKYYHKQKCFSFIHSEVDNNIKYINKVIIIKDIIECLFFIYTDFGEKKWDDKYWFFIGKLNNGIYFIYESDCCGTGFGLGSTSTLYLSKSKNLLYVYGLTNKHRELLNNNIHKRFIINDDTENSTNI